MNRRFDVSYFAEDGTLKATGKLCVPEYVMRERNLQALRKHYLSITQLRLFGFKGFVTIVAEDVPYFRLLFPWPPPPETVVGDMQPPELSRRLQRRGKERDA